MKKMMCILATAIAALVLTGCGGKPKIPANTVVACYVDLEKCLKNGNDIAELVIDNLPKHLKGKAEDAHEKAFLSAIRAGAAAAAGARRAAAAAVSGADV